MLSDLFYNYNQYFQNHFYLESNYNENYVYTKRKIYNYNEINLLSSVILPVELNEMMIYSYFENIKNNGNIICSAFPKILSMSMSQKVSTIIMEKYFPKLINFNNLSPLEFKKILFQILVICIIFNRIGIKHNDLHDKNILLAQNFPNDLLYDIDKYDNIDDIFNNNINFCIDDKYYTFQSDNIIKVIDYEYTCLDNFIIPYPISEQVDYIKDYSINSRTQYSYDFLYFISNIIYIIKSEHIYNDGNLDNLDIISELLEFNYNINCTEFEEKYISTALRPIGYITYNKLEPLLDFFKDFHIDRILNNLKYKI
jgi:hypothetical protein